MTTVCSQILLKCYRDVLLISFFAKDGAGFVAERANTDIRGEGSSAADKSSFRK
jgi:hypothetical protein